jgi:hypothetical protein
MTILLGSSLNQLESARTVEQSTVLPEKRETLGGPPVLLADSGAQSSSDWDVLGKFYG